MCVRHDASNGQLCSWQSVELWHRTKIRTNYSTECSAGLRDPLPFPRARWPSTSLCSLLSSDLWHLPHLWLALLLFRSILHLSALPILINISAQVNLSFDGERKRTYERLWWVRAAAELLVLLHFNCWLLKSPVSSLSIWQDLLVVLVVPSDCSSCTHYRTFVFLFLTAVIWWSWRRMAFVWQSVFFCFDFSRPPTGHKMGISRSSKSTSSLVLVSSCLVLSSVALLSPKG